MSFARLSSHYVLTTHIRSVARSRSSSFISVLARSISFFPTLFLTLSLSPNLCRFDAAGDFALPSAPPTSFLHDHSHSSSLLAGGGGGGDGYHSTLVNLSLSGVTITPVSSPDVVSGGGGGGGVLTTAAASAAADEVALDLSGRG